MKHSISASLRGIAVLLVALFAAWSCTTDNEPMPASSHPAELNIIVGPRPGYTEASTTRVSQTPDGTSWEAGDVLWFYVRFSWTSAGEEETEKWYVSALRYSTGAEWFPLSEQDSLDLNTGSIKPDISSDPDFYSISGFIRHPRWPAEALADGTTGAKADVRAFYLGNNAPIDGVLSLDYTTDVMEALVSSIAPGASVFLNFQHYYTRLHVTGATRLTLKDISYINEWDLSSESYQAVLFKTINVSEDGAYYFLNISRVSEISLDGKPYALVLPDGKTTYKGISYTLIPLSSGTVEPGE